MHTEEDNNLTFPSPKSLEGQPLYLPFKFLLSERGREGGRLENKGKESKQERQGRKVRGRDHPPVVADPSGERKREKTKMMTCTEMGSQSFMGSRYPSHRLGNGLVVSGRLEQPKEKAPTMSSAAMPYTGAASHSGSMMSNAAPRAGYTTSGPLPSGGLPGSASLKKSTLPATGRITSGPISSGPLNSSVAPRKVSGPLESTGSMKLNSSSISNNPAVTTLSQDDDYSVRRNFPKTVVWWLPVAMSLWSLHSKEFLDVSIPLQDYMSIRAWGSKPANPNHRHFTWGLRSSETHVVDFYISDFQSGLRALIKTGSGTRLYQRGSTVSVMGIVQRNENVLMIVPPPEPLATGWQCLDASFQLALTRHTQFSITSLLSSFKLHNTKPTGSLKFAETPHSSSLRLQALARDVSGDADDQGPFTNNGFGFFSDDILSLPQTITGCIKWLLRLSSDGLSRVMKDNIEQSESSEKDAENILKVETPLIVPHGSGTGGGTRAGLFRTPISGGVQSATSAHGLPRPPWQVRNLMEQARFAHLCTVMSRMHHRREGYPFGFLGGFCTRSNGAFLVEWLIKCKVTIFGDVFPLPEHQQEWAHKQYIAKHQQGPTQQWGNFYYFRNAKHKEYEALQPDKIAVDGGEQNLKVILKTLELLSSDTEVDDAAFISIDSKGTDIRVRQGAQFNIQRLSFEDGHAVETLEEAKAALWKLIDKGQVHSLQK
ncbi:hypothetical protein NC651_025870 [Populus alba x Populus x berolinensis]|nr:hypothetical protein NC651_025870 [Populus alba x Populus x berolinensis]